MKIEKLTREEIKRDLQAIVDLEQSGKSGQILYVFWCFVAFGGLALFTGALCLLGPAALGIIAIGIGTVVIVVGLIITLVRLSRLKKQMRIKHQQVEKEEFRIVGDKLERARMDDNFMSTQTPAYWQGSDLLKFARYGEYYIPIITHYTWSKDYYLSPDGMFNTSIVGDTFYLVILTNDPNKKIAMIYNTKFFKLQDDDPFDYEELS